MKKKTSVEWDKRYRDGWHRNRGPSQVIKKYVERIDKGRALDIACGTGENALYLAKNGFDVDAIDISKEAIEIALEKSRKKRINVNWLNEDLDEYILPINYYELVTSSNFYLKKELKDIVNSLKEGGYFIYHHHLKINEEKTPKAGPPNKYRFKPEEIKEYLEQLKIEHYNQDISLEDKQKAVFDLVAKKK